MPATPPRLPRCACSPTRPAGCRTTPATASASSFPPPDATDVLPVAAVVTDIEGTTTPIAFVRDTLFPFARGRLATFLAERHDDPAVAAELSEIRRLAPDRPPLDALLAWM